MCLVTNYAAFGSTNVSVHGTGWGRLSQLHLFRLRLTTISIFPHPSCMETVVKIKSKRIAVLQYFVSDEYLLKTEMDRLYPDGTQFCKHFTN